MPPQEYSQQETPRVTSFNSIAGIAVYDSDARKIGTVKQVGLQSGQAGIVLVVTKNDGSDIIVKWEEIRKIGEVVLLGSQSSDTNSKCNGCGFENKPDAKFCESCGKKLK